MNYTYIAHGTLKFNTGANWQINGTKIIRAYAVSSSNIKFSSTATTIKYTAGYIYVGSGSTDVSGVAIIQIVEPNYIYIGTGPTLTNGAVNIEIGYIYITIPTATRLVGAALYFFRSFQANFNYFAFGKIVLWNTGVDIDQIRYFGNVYTRFGPIISPLVNNNQPFTIN